MTSNTTSIHEAIERVVMYKKYVVFRYNLNQSVIIEQEMIAGIRRESYTIPSVKSVTEIPREKIKVAFRTAVILMIGRGALKEEDAQVLNDFVDAFDFDMWVNSECL